MAAQKGQQLAMAECRLPAKGRLSLLKEKKVVGTDVVSISERKRNRLEALELRQSISMNIKAVTIGTSATTTATSTSAATNISSSSTSLLRPPRHPVCNAKGMFNSSKPPNGDFEGPTYAKLAKVVLDGPIASQLQLSCGDNSNTLVDSMIRELVQDNGKAVRDLDSVLGSKVQDRVLLLDNPAGHGKAVERARKRAKKILSKRSNKHLSWHQHKLIGSYDFPSTYHKFDIFLPLHRMWKTYAIRVVNENRGKVTESSLLQLDLHGAFLAVVQAKINNQVGVEGIMIRETTNTYAIVTKTDKIKVIQKAGSVFVFRLDDMVITWFGDRASQ